MHVKNTPVAQLQILEWPRRASHFVHVVAAGSEVLQLLVVRRVEHSVRVAPTGPAQQRGAVPTMLVV
jgi:hypothetical protein